MNSASISLRTWPALLGHSCSSALKLVVCESLQKYQKLICRKKIVHGLQVTWLSRSRRDGHGGGGTGTTCCFVCGVPLIHLLTQPCFFLTNCNVAQSSWKAYYTELTGLVQPLCDEKFECATVSACTRSAAGRQHGDGYQQCVHNVVHCLISFCTAFIFSCNGWPCTV